MNYFLNSHFVKRMAVFIYTSLKLNNDYLSQLEKFGLIASGTNPKTGLVEIIEFPENDWFIGVQFHPEYKSTVELPHPLFVSFVSACLNYNKSKK